jgi:hypothetical protein
MGDKKKRGNAGRFPLGSLAVCFLFNGALIATLYVLARQALGGIHHALEPALAGSLEALPAELMRGLSGLGTFLDQREGLMAPVVFGLGAVMTLLLWAAIQILSRHGAADKSPFPEAIPVTTKADSLKKEVKRLEQEVDAARKAASRPSPGPAIQLLSVLQRKGRLVDFLQEDLSQYEDSQIGAAVRGIHQGCKEALADNLQLEPVLEQQEGEEVTVKPGFDPRTIRLTGNVHGDPPFRGTLRHRGWRVVRMDLPLKAPDQEKDWILVSAEVEIE